MIRRLVKWLSNKNGHEIKYKSASIFEQPQIKSVFDAFNKLKTKYDDTNYKLRIKLISKRTEITADSCEALVKESASCLSSLSHINLMFVIKYDGSEVYNYKFVETSYNVEDILAKAQHKIELLKRYAFIKAEVKRVCNVNFNYATTIKYPDIFSYIELKQDELLLYKSNAHETWKLLEEHNIKETTDLKIFCSYDKLFIKFLIRSEVSIEYIIETINSIKNVFSKLKDLECEYLKANLHSIIKVVYPNDVKFLYVSKVSEPIITLESIVYFGFLDLHIHTVKLDGVISYTQDLLNNPLTTLMPQQQAKLYFKDHYDPTKFIEDNDKA